MTALDEIHQRTGEGGGGGFTNNDAQTNIHTEGSEADTEVRTVRLKQSGLSPDTDTCTGDATNDTVLTSLASSQIQQSRSHEQLGYDSVLGNNNRRRLQWQAREGHYGILGDRHGQGLNLVGTRTEEQKRLLSIDQLLVQPQGVAEAEFGQSVNTNNRSGSASRGIRTLSPNHRGNDIDIDPDEEASNRDDSPGIAATEKVLKQDDLPSPSPATSTPSLLSPSALDSDFSPRPRSSSSRRHRPQPIPTIVSPRPQSGPLLSAYSYSVSRRSPYPLSSLRDRTAAASAGLSISATPSASTMSSPSLMPLPHLSATHMDQDQRLGGMEDGLHHPASEFGMRMGVGMGMGREMEMGMRIAGASSSSPYSPLTSSPGSMSMSSRRRRTKPEWPVQKSSRSSSFNQQRDRELYTTLQTPAVLRVPPTPYILGRGPGTSAAAGSGIPLPSARSAPGFGLGRVPITPVPINHGQSQYPIAGPSRRPDASMPAQQERVIVSDVPMSHVIATLNRRAGEFWSSPETSDCRIFIPTPRRDASKAKASPVPRSAIPQFLTPSRSPALLDPNSMFTPEAGPSENGGKAAGTTDSSVGMNGNLPGANDIPVLIFPLHRDYLITQSALLRQILSSANPILDMALPSSRPSPTRISQFRQQQAQAQQAQPDGGARGISPRPSSGQGQGHGRGHGRAPSQTQAQLQTQSMPAPTTARSPLPPNLKGAKILPSKEGEPVAVYLPLPDPTSFGVIVHWLYWGDIAALEASLSRGHITWQGIVKNIEYLALDDSIKRVMGKWWRRWVKTDIGRSGASQSQNQSAGPTSASNVGSHPGFGSSLVGKVKPGRKGSMFSDSTSTGSGSDAGDEADREDNVDEDGEDEIMGDQVKGGDDPGGVSGLLEAL